MHAFATALNANCFHKQLYHMLKRLFLRLHFSQISVTFGTQMRLT